MTLVGIAVSLFGILGILNPPTRRRVVWKR